MIFAVGARSPFPVVDGAFALSWTGGSFRLLVGSSLSDRDAMVLQTGRIDLAFKRIEVEGKPWVYCASVASCRPPLSGDTIVHFPPNASPLMPLPEGDRKLSYLCQLIAVNTPTQAVMATRMFTLDRAIGDLLWEVYQDHHASPPTDAEFARASSEIRAMPPPESVFSYPPRADYGTFLRQRLKP